MEEMDPTIVNATPAYLLGYRSFRTQTSKVYFRRSQTEKNISLTRVVRVKKKSNMENRLSC